MLCSHYNCTDHIIQPHATLPCPRWRAKNQMQTVLASEKDELCTQMVTELIKARISIIKDASSQRLLDGAETCNYGKHTDNGHAYRKGKLYFRCCYNVQVLLQCTGVATMYSVWISTFSQLEENNVVKQIISIHWQHPAFFYIHMRKVFIVATVYKVMYV